MVKMNGHAAEFAFYRPEAKRVDLAGEFNGWRVGQLRMKPRGDGYWHAAVRLAPGVYRFRYCVDGARWFPDFAAFGVQPGPFGLDAVLRFPDVGGRPDGRAA